MKHRSAQYIETLAQPQRRSTIGVVIPVTADARSMVVWAGAADTAHRLGVNLICFPFDLRGEAAPALYELVSASAVEGYIFHQWWTSQQHFENAYARCRPLPNINILRLYEGHWGVTANTYDGMREQVRHLIQAHGYRRVAFVRGPVGNPTAEDGYRSYLDTLSEYGLTPDPALVALGDFTAEGGAQAIHQWLDQAKLRPHLDLEAIVACNDIMANGILEALRERGLQVPYDIALVGFDNHAWTRTTVPPLTTVTIPYYEMGGQAVEMMAARLLGESPPEQVSEPTRLVVRRSCGCFSTAVTQAALRATARTEMSFDAALPSLRGQIADEMAQAVRGATPEQTAELVDSFAAEIQGKASAAFLRKLDDVLRTVMASGGDVLAWQGAISTLRRHTRPYLDSGVAHNAALLRAEDLWEQGRVIVGEAAHQAQLRTQAQAEQRAQALRALEQTLATTTGTDEIADALAERLPALGIPSCYLSLYENPDWSTSKARLVLAYDQDGRIPINPDEQRFDSRDLVPGGLLPQDQPYSMIVEALSFRERQIGFILFEANLRDSTLYEILRLQISSTLQETQLVEQTRYRAIQLQTATEVSRAISSILDPEELFQQTVNLVRERFGFYHVCLFLLDDESRHAVLRAGTGQAGQQMLAQEYRVALNDLDLAPGPASLIGECIASQQARLAADVHQEAAQDAAQGAAHVSHPLLPATRSELALPLVSRGRIIGAMTIQSDQPGAFSDQDVAVLQTIAAQAANAIENARLYGQAQAAVKELETTQQRYIQQAWMEYLRSIMATQYETTRPGVAPLGDDLLPEMRQAITQANTVALPTMAQTGDGHSSEITHAALVALVKLRGQVIGVLGVQDDDRTRRWTSEDIALVEAVAERMAQTAENLRLFDEAQRRAVREQLMGAITARMRESLDMERVLQTAAQEIGEKLGLHDIAIQLEVQEQA